MPAIWNSYSKSDIAQAAHDHAGVVLAHEVLEQAREALDLHIGVMAKHFIGDIQAFFEREERTFVAAVGDADHQSVEQPGCATYQILVAAGQRIERTWINGYNHCGSLGESPCKNAHYA